MMAWLFVKRILHQLLVGLHFININRKIMAGAKNIQWMWIASATNASLIGFEITYQPYYYWLIRYWTQNSRVLIVLLQKLPVIAQLISIFSNPRYYPNVSFTAFVKGLKVGSVGYSISAGRIGPCLFITFKKLRTWAQTEMQFMIVISHWPYFHSAYFSSLPLP